ncbi:hypothetical protein CRYUN_Cryun06bG0087300 [Craigia yunnanensis]
MIIGSKGFGVARRTSRGRLGSVSDYYVYHCICLVVVVRYPDEEESEIGGAEKVTKKKIVGEDMELQSVPKDELEYHDAANEHIGLGFRICN